MVKKCEVCGKRFVAYQSNQKCCSKSCGAQIRGNKSKCWDCKNYRCNWIAREQPVEGWEAVSRVYRLQDGSQTVSYKVIKCPEFM